MGSDQPPTGRQRVTVAEASGILGITVEAVRGRIKRGTLEHERDSGTVYVLLDADQPADQTQPADDQTTDRLQSDSTALISAKNETIAALREQLEAERQAHAEARRLLMAALERIPPQLEAPREARESPESPGPGDTPTEAPAEAQEATERPQPRPWWRRMFGFSERKET